MIYTITLNPSLDYIVKVENFLIGETNRAAGSDLYVGGKGINVSIVLSNIQVKNTALGFVAGFTGQEIINILNLKKINHSFTILEEGSSRINIKLKSNQETEINASGPYVSKDAFDKFKRQLDIITKGDMVVISGSLPNSDYSNLYRELIDYLKVKEVEFVIDLSNDSIFDLLDCKPLLIKPNLDELMNMFHVKHMSEEDIVRCIDKIRKNGVKNIIVSMGKDGAILMNEKGETFKALPIKGKLINSVGAGDSMVAGFVAGMQEFNDSLEAFKLSIACASATAFSKELATKQEIDELLNKVEIISI